VERRRVLISILRPAAGLGILAAILLSSPTARGQDLPSGTQLNLEWAADPTNPVEWGRFHLVSPSVLSEESQSENFSLVFVRGGVGKAVSGRRSYPYPSSFELANYAGTGCPAGWFHIHVSTVCPVEGAAACGAVCFAQPNCGATLSWISFAIPPVCQDMCKCDPEE
jgi:hypothetical protein